MPKPPNLPLRSLRELALELSVDSRHLIALIAAEVAAQRPAPVAFRPKPQSICYYKHREFLRWFSNLKK